MLVNVPDQPHATSFFFQLHSVPTDPMHIILLLVLLTPLIFADDIAYLVAHIFVYVKTAHSIGRDRLR